ncbi:AtpZ/AtpI family protein [Crassaminicella thermophila]|uniref:AtpZ/AtpI family protein n=1 Tax=Crassaminicella thermophila TaxID=2599308 RepID=A0A5C0SF11_CRATE|nr:AtpZ/AtpI family protein [Crassaminicella thermophila]QEK13225.1 AtpZ/AtpI family protein [Crassaminicella thermophila]
MQKNYTRILRNLSLLTYIGVAMIVPILAAVYLGNWADEKLGTNHIFLIVGILLGVASSFLNVYKIVMKDIKKK